jgi:hypothetical protein
MFEEYERINNIKLVWNNLLHIGFEFASKSPSSMRIAKESHQLLLRAMVEALRGSANISITGRPQKSRRRWYRQAGGPWYVIEKVEIPGCKKAWRYSEPQLSQSHEIPAPSKDAGVLQPESFLLGFYDLLAMIQTPCFMHRFVHSRFVSVSAEEMQSIEWLHEAIRNEFEHFVPKLLLVSSGECLNAAEICAKLAKNLLCDSGHLIHEGLEALCQELERLLTQMQQIRERIENA